VATKSDIARIEASLGVSLEVLLRQEATKNTPLGVLAARFALSIGELKEFMGEKGIQDFAPGATATEVLLIGYVRNDPTHIKRVREHEETQGRKMGRLTKEFFERTPVQVARDLLGRYVFCQAEGGNVIQARLREVAAYQGATKTTSPGASYAGGIVSISQKFGRYLIDIATGEEDEPSCITLRGGNLILEDKVESASGPGNLAIALGINEDNVDYFQGASIAGRRIWVEGDAVNQSEVRKLKGNSPNCKGIYKF